MCHEQRQYATHLGRIQVYLADHNVYEDLGKLRIQRISYPWHDENHEGSEFSSLVDWIYETMPIQSWLQLTKYTSRFYVFDAKVYMILICIAQYLYIKCGFVFFQLFRRQRQQSLWTYFQYSVRVYILEAPKNP